MPTIPLPENASLEHLKSQAKLVRDLVRSGDEGALSMVDEFHPRRDAADLSEAEAAAFKLSDAQLIIARMYRCASWNQLRAHIDVVVALTFTPAAEKTGYVDFDESFVELACLNYAENGPNPHDRIERANQQLAADPTLATGSMEAAATVGDHHAVAEFLEAQPSLASENCGPNDWPPLLYATYSRVQTGNADWSALETTRTLLAAGADPNAGFLWRGLVPPFTALTGAIGSLGGGHPIGRDWYAMARLLLEAGADPNDGQTLYNNGIGGKNHDEPRYLQLLLEFGLGTPQGGPWYNRLGSQLADPADWLHHDLEAAVKRNRPNHLRLLISLGADLDGPVGRSQKTPVRIAAEHGNHQILQMLSDAGLDISLTPDEEFLEAIRTSDDKRLAQLLANHPELAENAATNHAGAIKGVTADGALVLQTLLGLGLDINARSGGNGSTALHEAAQANDVELAKLLVANGADPNLTDNYVDSTPWGWANHFHQDEVAAYLEPLTGP